MSEAQEFLLEDASDGAGFGQAASDDFDGIHDIDRNDLASRSDRSATGDCSGEGDLTHQRELPVESLKAERLRADRLVAEVRTLRGQQLVRRSGSRRSLQSQYWSRGNQGDDFKEVETFVDPAASPKVEQLPLLNTVTLPLTTVTIEAEPRRFRPTLREPGSGQWISRSTSDDYSIGASRSLQGSTVQAKRTQACQLELDFERDYSRRVRFPFLKSTEPSAIHRARVNLAADAPLGAIDEASFQETSTPHEILTFGAVLILLIAIAWWGA